MGVGNGDAVADDGGRSIICEISCSICMEAVTDDGTRSLAKLLCGHQFHLDCIGSAFNVKGAMQCPNCRKLEKGQWLYASGSRSLPDLVMDDWTQDEDRDMFDLSYSEMSFGFHWCPFSGLARLPSSFDEGEFPSSTYQDLFGHHDVYVEPAPVSSTNHPCPYIAFPGPVHPSTSASNHGVVSDGSTYSSHWSGPSAPNEVFGSYGFPSVDVHYHGWDRSTFGATAHRTGGPRTARNGSDVPRPTVQPVILGHGSASGAPSSLTAPSMVPSYSAAVARPHRDHASLQANPHQSTGNPQAARVPPTLNNGRRTSTGHRGAVARVAPPMVVASSSAEQQNNGGFYFFSSAARTPEGARNDHRFRYWEHDYNPERDSSSSSSTPSIWGPLYPPNGAGSYGSRAWHGSSQNRS